MLVMREDGRGETRFHALRSKHVDVSQGAYAIKAMVANHGVVLLRDLGYAEFVGQTCDELHLRVGLHGFQHHGGC